MANPTLVTISPKNAWQKVATNIVTGRFIIKDSSPDQYLYTYKDTGDPAPTTTPIGNHIDRQLEFSSGVGSDIYIYAKGEIGIIEAQL
jgi:hypothetical protein